MSAADEVRGAVAAINRAWLDGRFDDLKRHFHPDVVLARPGFGERTVGRDALIAGYVDFAANARVLELSSAETQADETGDVVVAVTPWRMRYEFGGSEYDEHGWDVLVFSHNDGAWVVVWRTVIVG